MRERRSLGDLLVPPGLEQSPPTHRTLVAPVPIQITEEIEIEAHDDEGPTRPLRSETTESETIAIPKPRRTRFLFAAAAWCISAALILLSSAELAPSIARTPPSAESSPSEPTVVPLPAETPSIEPISDLPVRRSKKAPARRASPPPREPDPSPPSDPVLLELDMSLARVKADRSDGRAITELGRRVAAIAGQLPDSAARTEIRRCATGSSISYDVDGLEACVRRLKERLLVSAETRR